MLHGVILISKSAFLFPKEADSSSMNKPSPKAVFIGIIDDDEKYDMKVMITVTTKPHIRNIDVRDIIYIFIFNIRI
jgi:hypothetical protein